MIAAARISARQAALKDSDRQRIEAAFEVWDVYLISTAFMPETCSTRCSTTRKFATAPFILSCRGRVGKVEVTRDVPFPVVRDVVKELLDESKRPR